MQNTPGSGRNWTTVQPWAPQSHHWGVGFLWAAWVAHENRSLHHGCHQLPPSPGSLSADLTRRHWQTSQEARQSPCGTSERGFGRRAHEIKISFQNPPEDPQYSSSCPLPPRITIRGGGGGNPQALRASRAREAAESVPAPVERSGGTAPAGPPSRPREGSAPAPGAYSPARAGRRRRGW